MGDKERAMQILISMIYIFLSVVYHKAIADDYAAKWSYKGESGPIHWSKLSKGYSLCTDGKEQSPIAIDKSLLAKREDIVVNYKAAAINIINTPNTIQFNYSPGSTIIVDNKTYQLVQIHFHSPSENKIGDKPFPMEVHLVHKDDKRALAVIGVFVVAGKKNRFLEVLWDNWPEGDNYPAVIDSNIQLNAEGLLPKERHFYHYEGSLTTPPCNEGVDWYLFRTPIEASHKQIRDFRQTLSDGENARPIQPLNGRKVN